MQHVRYSYLILFWLVLTFASCTLPQNKPVEVTTPTTVSAVVSYDSLAFLISVYKDYIKVKLQEEEKQLKNFDSLDNFIAGHKSVIDKNKIMVFASNDLLAGSFKSLTNVLRKHDYNRFSLISDPDQ